MTVTLLNKNGLRVGTFHIAGVRGTIPNQAITSTNLNHAKSINKKINFQTNILEFLECDVDKLLTSTSYRSDRKDTIQEMLKGNPGYLSLFMINDIRSTTRRKFTRADNETLIAFQRDCGLSLIKVFFNENTKNILSDATHYRKLVDNGKFVACIDENMSNNLFEQLYLDCIDHGDEVISFFGRRPSRAKNRLNFLFLRSRNDPILRITSATDRTKKTFAIPFIQHYYGLDVFSFKTNRPPPDDTKPYTKNEAEVLDYFNYKLLQLMPPLKCVITKQSLSQSISYFAQYKKSHVPVFTYNIVRLNEIFKTLHNNYTDNDLERILKSVLS